MCKMTDRPNLQTEEEVESETLRKHSLVIEDIMDPDYGLLDQLLEMGALSRREIHDVKSERTFEKRNAKIIEYITQHGRFRQFMIVLRNTNQKHLANYLIADGVHRSAFGNDWPLTEQQMAVLNRNQLILIDSLDEIHGLSVAMFSADIINKRHTETIHSQPTNHEMSEVLLDIIVRSSQANYSKTLDCMEKESNRHVVEIIRSRGVVVQVIANLETDVAEKMEIEKELAAKTNSWLRNPCSLECVEAISEIKREGLIGAKFGHSVALYFNCETSDDLNHLWKLMSSGRLKDLVENYFNRLLSTERHYKVSLKWSSDDYSVKQTILNEVLRARVGQDAAMQPCSQVDSGQSTHIERVASNPNAEKLRVHAKIYGVTKLNQLLYVLCRSPSTIYVFSDEHLSKLMSEIKINELRFDGYDMSSCPVSSCLYVSDTSGNGIFKIPVEDPSQMACWLKDEMTPPWTLSVCRNTGDVLIPRNKEPKVLELYNSKAVKLYSVQLTSDVSTLKHAVLNSVGRFIIIHKWKDTGVWGVSEINREGEIVSRFKRKDKTQMLSNPCHLTLDHNDRVIVTDLMKNRVVRFDRDLNWESIVLTEDKDELQQPLRLFYDLEKRQLIVGQENGTVGIYSI